MANRRQFASCFGYCRSKKKKLSFVLVFILLQCTHGVLKCVVPWVSGEHQCLSTTYTPNSTAARRNWRKQPYSSCRLDSQCSSDREEEEQQQQQKQEQEPYCSVAAIEKKKNNNNNNKNKNKNKYKNLTAVLRYCKSVSHNATQCDTMPTIIQCCEILPCVDLHLHYANWFVSLACKQLKQSCGISFPSIGRFKQVKILIACRMFKDELVVSFLGNAKEWFHLFSE